MHGTVRTADSQWCSQGSYSCLQHFGIWQFNARVWSFGLVTSSKHRDFMAYECQTIDRDGMARDHLQVSEKHGTPLSTLPWRLITN